jgi:hypothetical protein
MTCITVPSGFLAYSRSLPSTFTIPWELPSKAMQHSFAVNEYFSDSLARIA